MAALAAVEQQVLDRLRDAERVFGFLDFDGTLASLAPAPDQARPLAGTAGSLREIAALPGTRAALVSGRSVADLRRFLGVLRRSPRVGSSCARRAEELPRSTPGEHVVRLG